MGGRGRGRAALSFNVEALGIAPGEALPGPQVQPPPTYPILEFHPAPIQPNATVTSRLRYKLGFLNHFSRFKMESGVKDVTPGYKRKLNEDTSSLKTPLDYRWEFFPAELRPNAPKRLKVSKGSAGPSASKKVTNIDEVLAALEKAETVGTVIKTEEVENENNKNNDEVDEEAFDESDQEMDEGTDYNQNYFDNGDDYLDDEGDDDGPVY